MSGYAALYESAAWLDLSSRAKIQVRGEDRVGFMQAMCSQDIESLEPGCGTYAFFLNVQGRIQADGHVYVAQDHVLLDTAPERAAPLIQHLEKFIVMDDVTLEDRTAALATVALEGPRSEELGGRALDMTLPPLQTHSHIQQGETRILRSSFTGQPGLWVITDTNRKEDLVAKLEAAGAAAAKPEEARAVRIENRLPSFGEDFFDSTIPQETQRLEAVSFTKGCYLGQEIVERVRSRGQVHRLLTAVELEGRTAPPNGSPVFSGEREIGRITSLVFSPRLQRVVGFAILRRESAVAGAELTVDGLRGRVRESRN